MVILPSLVVQIAELGRAVAAAFRVWRMGFRCGLKVFWMALMAALALPAVALLPGAAAAGADAGVASASLAPADRDAALAEWMEFVEAEGMPAGWTGSVEECKVGSESADSLQASLDTVNLLRAFTGVEPVRFSATRNREALAAALAIRAAGDLSHEIDASWPCHSEDAENGAARSNLFLGRSGAQAMVGYVNDAGVDSLGHRRWLLNPGAVEFGSGSTGQTNALHVLDAYADGSHLAPLEPDNLVAWPPPGWVPQPWVFKDWSAAIGLDPSRAAEHGHDLEDVEVDISEAEVDVELEGRAAQVSGLRRHADGYGTGPMLSWRTELPAQAASSAGASQAGTKEPEIQVSISGVTIGGEPEPIEYTVRPFTVPQPKSDEPLTPEAAVRLAQRCKQARRLTRRARLQAVKTIHRTRKLQAVIRRAGPPVARKRLRLSRTRVRRARVQLKRHRTRTKRICTAALA